MPARRRRFHQLPVELYNEIISYLWNDIPSLKACSLANPIMTAPSQKRLFHCIALCAPLPKLRNEYEIFTNGLCSTSYNFWQLLVKSPHIAKYVASLHIVDRHVHYKPDLGVRAAQRGFAPRRGVVPVASVTIDESTVDEAVDDGLQYLGYKLGNGQDVDLDAPLSPSTESRRDLSRLHRWLPTDKFLPLSAPLLCNLRSLAIFYDLPWCELSGRVLITLLNLMQRQSLRYLQFDCNFYPDIITRQALGENVKHLVLDSSPEKLEASLRLPHPSLSAPVYLDSLSIDMYTFPSLGFLPDCRVQISRLRKLVVRVPDNYHAAIWSLLQSCSATLQDFEICPSCRCESFTYWSFILVQFQHI